MKKVTFILFSLAICSSGCIKRIHDPHEVVDQSYIHRYGVPVEETRWQSQGSSGQVVTTLKSGVVVSSCYNEGVLHGDTSYTYPHSDLVERTEFYQSGELQKHVSYYRNGAPSQEVSNISPISQKIVAWYDNGAPQSTEIHENGLIISGEYYDSTHRPDSKVDNGNGFRTRRDAFGHIQGTDTVVEGIVVSTRTFHPNGAVKEEIPYFNNQVHGQLKTYHPDGVPISIQTWADGEQTGTTRYFENGELISEVPYVQGVKEGVEKRYRNGKVVVAETSWSNDQRHGPSSSYIGEVAKTDYFYQGNPVSRSVYDKMSAR